MPQTNKNRTIRPNQNMKTIHVKHLLAGFGLLALNLQLHAQDFALSSTPGVGRAPASVVAADVNRDGKMDLICANFNDATITVLTNDGNGILVSNVSYSTYPYPKTLVATDLNGDGKVDLACVCTSGRLLVWTNNGSGNFVSVGSYATGSSAPRSWITAADINGDGKTDLICQETDLKMLVLTNAGDGTFATAPSPPGTTAGSWLVTAADVNGDGKLDLIDIPYGGGNHYLRILTNAGNGNFILSSTNDDNTPWPGYMLATDVNGDGKVDIFVSNYNSGSGKTVLVLTNDGTGLFGSNAVYTVDAGPISGAAVDVNGDGMVDLINGSFRGNLTILTNNGSSFGSNTTLNGVSSYPVSVTAADVSGDGRLDLITANNNNNNSPGTLSIWINILTFLPNLAVKRASNDVIVSWPSQWTGWAGWTLQQNTDLSSANWTPCCGTIGDDGTTKSMTNSSSLGNLFFRLAHP